jgi:hypothetical protein
VNPDGAQAGRGLLEAWLAQRRVQPVGEVTLVRCEVIAPGRPGLLDIVAEAGGRLAHVVVGLRAVGAEPHFLHAGEESALGLWEDEDGLAVCTDALRDAQLAPLLLATIRGVDPRPGPVTVLRDDDEVTALDCGDRGDLIVFPWLGAGPHPAVDLMVALEAAGFNHVAAPLVRWVWADRDLGVVQEPLADRSGGWALVLTSLRDLYASGGAPEAAGGDFGSEALALGTMTARMHLALDRAFPRAAEPVSGWVDDLEASMRKVDPSVLEDPGVTDLTKALREAGVRLPAIRTHGDFHLGRTARTDQGWVVADCSPGGVPAGATAPALRSPLCDVADLLYSLHQASMAVAAEQDPAGRLGLEPLGRAWERRNRRAFMSGYLGTPGIPGLTGTDRELALQLVAFFELARSMRPD